ncbi:MAG: molybdenum cofactor biosynthesis protein MoaE [Candidatus Dormibacteria bacterium]
MPGSTVRIRIFASLRERAGVSEVTLELEGPVSVETCWKRLCELHPELAPLRGSTRSALNLVWSDWSAAVSPGDELAFLPPVSGGSGPAVACAEVWVGPEPIDVGELTASIERRGIGAIATFVGLVRDPDGGREVSHLSYEAYPEMARPQLAAIAEDACRRFGATQVVVRHRTGRVGSGETSVVVVVGAPHRGAALLACGFVMDELKSRVPIWKASD